MREWSNKRYWIVGASEGLGLALAKRCLTLVRLWSLRLETKAFKRIALSLPNQTEVLP